MAEGHGGKTCYAVTTASRHRRTEAFAVLILWQGLGPRSIPYGRRFRWDHLRRVLL
jgi:hypothetical protein